MQGKISVWVSNTFKTENEAEGKIVQDISRVIEIQKIIVGFICTSCDEPILDDEDLRNHKEHAHADEIERMEETKGEENIPVIFSCEKCKYSSKQKSNVKRHKKSKHDSGNAKNFHCKNVIIRVKQKVI